MADTPLQYWYGVRTVQREDRIEDGKPIRVFEERVVVVRAKDHEEALTKGEAEARQYAASGQHAAILEHIVAYNIHGDDLLQDGDEVWSCIRGLDCTDEGFLDRVYEGEWENLTNAFRSKEEG